ncbi:MAG: hypothetical protein IKG93_10015 [Clostridiales bacterium]|nr:hypothetical protein [Clostridiales bacterium]
MKYICEHCGKDIGKNVGGSLGLSRLREEGHYCFRLCTKCAKELIAYVDAYIQPCIQNHKVERPHRIINEEVLIKQASRQDVRDFLVEYGIDEEMAFSISEQVRKGHFSSRVNPSIVPKVILDTLVTADVPEWFFEGCKKIMYLSDRKNYNPPCLVDDLDSEEDCVEVLQCINLEIIECE